MNYKIEESIITLNYIVFTIILIVLAAFSGETLLFYFLYVLFLISYTIRTFLLNNNKKVTKVLMIIFEGILVSFITYFTKNPISFVIYLFLIGEIILDYERLVRNILLGIMYLLFASTNCITFSNNRQLVLILLIVSIPTYVIFIILYRLIDILNKNIKEKNEEMKNLTLRKIEKNKLYEELEELTIRNERTRIAGEIHDSVGHNLTASLTQIEAAKRLLNKDKNLAIEKLNIAQQQIREGLKEIRQVVRVMEERNEKIDLYKSMVSFIKESEKNFGINIKYFINDENYISENISLTLLRALKEGITNGVKHGKSTAFIFKLYKSHEGINFFLQNNGEEAVDINYGFGLREIKDRVYRLNGDMTIISSKGEGCTLKISIPFN